MNPENVQPKKFEDVKVVYVSPDGFFSIATGIGDGGNEYQTERRRYALRWNGHDDTQKGFPMSNGHPMWFQLPTEIDEKIIGNIISALECQRRK